MIPQSCPQEKEILIGLQWQEDNKVTKKDVQRDADRKLGSLKAQILITKAHSLSSDKENNKDFKEGT